MLRLVAMGSLPSSPSSPSLVVSDIEEKREADSRRFRLEEGFESAAESVGSRDRHPGTFRSTLIHSSRFVKMVQPP